MRFARLFTLVLLLACVAAPAAAAFGFTDEALLTPNGVLGQPYSFKLDARNGCPPYTFHVDSGNLPPGLVMDPSGQISGTPAAAGTWSWWGRVTNVCPADHSERLLSITITRPTPAAVAAQKAEVGLPWSEKLFAADDKAPTPFRWNLTGGALPAGLQVDNVMHVVSGTPTRPGHTTAAVAVFNDRGRLTPLDVSFAVAAHVAVRTAALPRARVGHAYRARIRVAGGVAPLRWRVGALPAGLRFDRSADAIVGTPRRAASARVAVHVLDTLGAGASHTLGLRITR